MKRKERMVSALLVAISMAIVGVTSLARIEAQKSPWAVHRTPWGDPDLQGIWTDDAENLTPTERPTCEKPDGYTGERPRDCNRPVTQQTLTDEEYADRLKVFEGRLSVEEATPQTKNDAIGTIKAATVQSSAGHVWHESTPSQPSKRTSMIVDPPDGRIPPYTPEGQKRYDANLAARLDARRARGGAAESAAFWASNASSWFSAADVELWSRCISKTLPGGWIPKAYNNNRQILQVPGYVVIVFEQIHEVRVIPLDGRPHLGSAIREWMGDSRGHWEGDTLVVEVTNFYDRVNITAMSFDKDDIPVTPNFRLVERFTPVGDHKLTYEATIDDPGTWTKPIKLVLDQAKDDKQTQIMEYACHEGNYNLLALCLRALRVVDAEANAKLTKISSEKE
jgi:hypothetical protein